MTMTLYHGVPNGPSFTVLAALFEKLVEPDLVAIDLAGGERHRVPASAATEVAMSIEGEGPVLVVDGQPMADSVFIACYLDDIGAGPALRPEDPYARWEMMAWCRHVIERVAPAAAFLGTRAHLADELAAMDAGAFDALVAPIVSVDLADRWTAVRERDFADARVADSEAKIVQAADKVETRLEGRAWLMNEFSIADLETYAWLSGMRELVPGAFADKPHTAAWFARVAARPAVARALALAAVAHPERVWAPGPEINRWG